MSGPDHELRSDRRLTLAVIFLFSLTLGIGTVAIPLLALGAGYDAPSIGFLVAVAALSQLTSRLGLPWLLRRFADRWLIALACASTAIAFGLLLASTAVAVFVAAQLFQGFGRGVLWTSAQTHVARRPEQAVGRLVDLYLAGNLGTLSGPVIAGTLAAIDLSLAPAVAAVLAAVAAILACLLQRLPPFDRRGAGGNARLLRQEGVAVGSWAAFVTGGWWSMLGSYVPVILAVGGFGPQAIGWMIAGSEAAGALSLPLLRRTPAERVRGIVLPATILTTVALAAVALAPAHPVVYAVLLACGGAVSAAAGSLAPALASVGVSPEERGDALSLTGITRALALLVAPASAGVLVSVIALGPAVAFVGVVLAVPGVLAVRVTRPR
jgi:MFS family permease